MMTKDQYIESLRKLNLNLYMFGKKVENPVDDPVIRPSLNSFAATYELPGPAVSGSENCYLPHLRQEDQPLHPHASVHR